MSAARTWMVRVGEMSKRLPPSLPPEVVDQIWREILDEETNKSLQAAIKADCVVFTKKTLLDFAQAAMEYPHFASAAEIAAALKIGQTQSYAIVSEIKLNARSTRK